MALQQISLGGASSPVSPIDATSTAAQQQGQSSTTTGLSSYQQYLQDIASTPFPDVTTGLGTPQIYTPPAATTPLTGAVTPPPQAPTSPNIKIDPFTQPLSDADVFVGGTGAGQPAEVAIQAGAVEPPGNPYAWDPFSFAGAGEGAALTSEQNSPGYQQFGQNWLDLLNTVSSQNLQWGGTNQYSGELKGGGSVGPWLSQNIVTPYNNGNQNDALANAIYFISSQTGKPATDPEVQQMGGAFLDYTLQNASRYGANTANFDKRKASEGGLFGGIFGDILSAAEIAVSLWQPELIPLTASLSAGMDLSQGNYLGAGLSALGGIGGGLSDLGSLTPELSNSLGLTETASEFGPSLAADQATLEGLSTAGQIASGAATAGQLGEALSQGNFLGALGPGVELGSSVVSAMPNSSTPTGTTGTNAPESGGALSSLANSLGLTQQELADYAGGALSLGGAGVPLIQAATAGGPPTLNVSAPLPPPPAPATPPPGPPSAPGQPLTPEQIYNPAAASYQQPGSRQANPQQIAEILRALGIAA